MQRTDQDYATGYDAETINIPGGPSVVLRRQHGQHSWLEELASDVRSGLTGDPKELPPKYFYDARGSALFDAITELPEYYQTRTERSILRRIAPGLAQSFRPTSLIEFGSGSADKTRVLLDAMKATGVLRGFGPIDVSETALLDSARRLMIRYPDLTIEGVIGDFEQPFPLPFHGQPRLLAFLGSTIGNMRSWQAQAFLTTVAEQLSHSDAFLIGFDLVKDVSRIEAAYNDSLGVTREFNLNVLRVLNRELEADFELEGFEHLALYDEPASRIEMRLVSTRAQTAHLKRLELDVTLAEGEAIRTELSHKYTRGSASRLLARAGLELTGWETDPENLFALGLARATTWPK
jgi:L-histidine N-alpha-methyltransferase